MIAHIETAQDPRPDAVALMHIARRHRALAWHKLVIALLRSLGTATVRRLRMAALRLRVPVAHGRKECLS